MNKTIFRFNFFDMPVSVPRSAQIGILILVIICTALAVYFTDLTPLDSLIAGILATVIHWLSDFLHQYGHFMAAKWSGKPSSGLRLWWILGTIRYPRDEGDLPPALHIRRAIGGPVMSMLVLIVFLLLWNMVGSYSPMAGFLLAWGIFVQLVVFTLGALTPVSIGNFNTDGATILKALLEMRRQAN